MAAIPHDIADLYLAPVLLGIDARIEEYSRLDADELAFQIALEGDRADWTLEFREAGLLQAVSRFVETHDWELSMDSRGIRLTHGEHTVVLGIPDTFEAYLSGSAAPKDE
jgi:hypothetical protein